MTPFLVVLAFVVAMAFVAVVMMVGWCIGRMSLPYNGNHSQCRFCRSQHEKMLHEDIEGWRIQ